MTRINAGIPPIKLSNAHLIAEHREIKRIPNHLKKHGIKCIKDIPEKFTLGKGHVKFFFDKGYFTKQRYIEIYKECLKREFNVTNFLSSWDIYEDHPDLYKDYEPSKDCIILIKTRIKEKSLLK